MALFNKKTETVETTPKPTNVGRTQTLSLTGFIAAFIEPIVAIVLGHVALRNYKKETDQTWRGFATAGTILGYVGLVIRVKLVALFFILAALTAGGHGYNKYDYDTGNMGYGKSHSDSYEYKTMDKHNNNPMGIMKDGGDKTE